MHIEMRYILSVQAVADIEKLVARYGTSCPAVLWPYWMSNLNTKATSIDILQAAAQIISGFRCDH